MLSKKVTDRFKNNDDELEKKIVNIINIRIFLFENKIKIKYYLIK
jgi:hypothetical protein